MMVFVWIYSVVGSIYFLMYSSGMDVVVRYAVGPLWLLMVLAPVILSFLVLLPIARHFGLFDE